MTVLDVVVTDLLIGQRFVSLGQLDESVVECLDGLVLGGVRADLVRVVDERKALVVSRNRFFVGALSTEHKVSIFPRNRSTKLGRRDEATHP